jgi:NADPH-dependent 2,4-dienoyl-CoA reductase/sulfur reductase-like enzyme
MEIVIIGNGISGITTARWLRKLGDYKIKVVSSETDHFFSRTALMYIYMGHMRYEDTKPYEDWFWEKNRIELVNEHIDGISFAEKQLNTRSGKSISYDKLVFALGSTPNKFGWPGQDLNGVGGLYHYQDLENMEKYSENLERAVVVGGGLIGLEMAEMFKTRNIDVTMLVREPSYWINVMPPEESQMISRHIRAHHIDLRLGVNLGEIVDDGNGKACAVVIKENSEKIDCGYVGLTAGVSPNIKWLKETGLETNRGILVNNNLETNIKDVYAIGDCAELSTPNPGRRGIEAIWYTGRMMGETVAYNIYGKSIAYDPGIWFNSAKFLDIEYQVYGDVRSQLPEEHTTLYWEHSDGDKSVRINYDTASNEIKGFNLMGIRFRHEVCEKWIKEKTHVEQVLKNLSLANFDPEFYAEYESNIVNSYNKINGTNISLKSKRSLTRVLSFLKR